MDKRSTIKKLIESFVDEAFEDSRLFLEAEDDELDLGGGAGGEADDLGDLELDAGGEEGEDFGDGDLDGGGEMDLDGGGDLEGGEEGEEDLDGDMGDDFGGGGGGGFAGGGGMGGDEGFDDSDGAGEADDAEGDLPQEVELPADPIQAAVDIAINMLEETGDDNKILSAVKASIQGNFESFSDATPIIKSLWDTEHPTLKVVARKLLLFIQGR